MVKNTTITKNIPTYTTIFIMFRPHSIRTREIISTYDKSVIILYLLIKTVQLIYIRVSLMRVYTIYVFRIKSL